MSEPARQPRRRKSLSLNATQIALILHGAKHAEQIGKPLNRFITINWSLAGTGDVQAAQGCFIKHLSDWLRARGHSLAYVWVIEYGPVKGVHTHLIAHVPPELISIAGNLQRGWLKATGAKARKGVIYTCPIGANYSSCLSQDEHLNAAYQHNLAAVLTYLCKAADDEARLKFEINRAPQTGEVSGKRAGTSRNIGTKAILEWKKRNCRLVEPAR